MSDTRQIKTMAQFRSPPSWISQLPRSRTGDFKILPDCVVCSCVGEQILRKPDGKFSGVDVVLSRKPNPGGVKRSEWFG